MAEVKRLSKNEVNYRAHKEEEEQIWVFQKDDVEPTPLLDLQQSLVKRWAKFFFQACRLYVVVEGPDGEEKVVKLRAQVKSWGVS